MIKILTSLKRCVNIFNINSIIALKMLTHLEYQHYTRFKENQQHPLKPAQIRADPPSMMVISQLSFLTESRHLVEKM